MMKPLYRRPITIIILPLLLMMVITLGYIVRSSIASPLNQIATPILPPGLNLPTPTRLSWCAPLPQVPLDIGPKTSTPDISQAYGTQIPYLSPSVTPIPYANIVDMDPQMPDRDKSYVVVYRCNGTFDLYKIDDSNPKNIPLNEGDVIYLRDAPLSVMEVHPYPTRITPSPTTIPFTSTPFPVTLISEQQARDQAVKIASTDDFHFTGVAGPVRNVRAEKMTFQSAIQYMQDQQYSFGYDSAKDATTNLVWLVMMEGVWPQNFPVFPSPTPTYPPWRSLAIVLDATTGEMLCMGARK